MCLYQNRAAPSWVFINVCGLMLQKPILMSLIFIYNRSRKVTLEVSDIYVYDF